MKLRIFSQLKILTGQHCFEIKEILDRWYKGDLNPEFPVANYFKVSVAEDKIFILKHEIKSGKWFLWIHGVSMNL